METFRAPTRPLHLWLSARTERHALQAAVALVGFVPVLSGLAGALFGSGQSGGGVETATLDSQTRFLSGVQLALGLALWEAIPQIERRRTRLGLLAMLVVFGGLMRLVGMLLVDAATWPMIGMLSTELVAMPALCLWQSHVARRCGMSL